MWDIKLTNQLQQNSMSLLEGLDMEFMRKTWDMRNDKIEKGLNHEELSDKYDIARSTVSRRLQKLKKILSNIETCLLNHDPQFVDWTIPQFMEWLLDTNHAAKPPILEVLGV